MKQQDKLRRIACNEVVMPDGQRLTLCVVEISNGCMVNHYPLRQESADTEWWRGEIVLKDQGDGTVSAYYKGKLII